MQSVAQAWLVYRLTDSAMLLGLVGFAGQIPVFLLAIIGGAFADRHNRHRLLIMTQIIAMLFAFMLAALTLTHHIQVWHVFVFAALMGIVNALDIPTRQAFVVEMVGKADLANAIALNSLLFNGARMIGPAIAGLLIATFGEGWCFFANGASYGAVIVSLAYMRLASPMRTSLQGSFLAHIAEGFRFAWHTHPVRALLLLTGLVSLMGMPYAVLMPIFADSILHAGASGLGLLMGASGVGAALGALSLAARQNIRGLGRWVALSSLGLGIGLILFSLSHLFWLSAILLLPTGFAMIVTMAASNTLIQAMVPDHLRGRVMAIYSMTFLGIAPFGALLAGILAPYLGAPNTILLGGLICIMGATIFAWRLPALRVQAQQIIPALQAVSGDPPDELTTSSNALTSRQG